MSDLLSYDSLWAQWELSQRLAEQTGAPVTADQPILADRYALETKIGSGQFGRVYLATDLQLRRKVAIKTVQPSANWEAIALAKLRHPNVVTLFDHGVADGCGYLVLELLEGCTLTVWRSGEPRTRREIVEAYLAAGRGIAAAHRVGLVHRDIKPDNIMMCDDGRVVVVDFGVAVRADVPGRDGPLSLGYCAPEQLAGGRVSAASDQFSFCVALWEALTGSSPFVGATVAARMQSHLDGPREKDPHPPGALERVLRRGLSITPAQRWPSMLALLDELARVERVRARRPTIVAVGSVLASALTLAAVFGPSRTTDAGAGDGALSERDLTVRSLTLLAEAAAEDGRATDALRLLDAAEFRSMGDSERRLVADSADAVGLSLFAAGEYTSAAAAHQVGERLYRQLNELALAMRSLELTRASVDARAL